MAQTRRKIAETTIHSSLLVLTLVYLVSGLGITQYHIIETLTLGLLTRNLALIIHEDPLTRFIVLLLAHVLLSSAVCIYNHFRNH